MFSSGTASVIPNIGDVVSKKSFDNVNIQTLADSFTWPNKVQAVPKNVFGDGVNAISVPDGFLPPGHTNGGIYIITTDPSDLTKSTGTIKISQEKSGFFYHMGKWFDVNGDGKLDYLTTRTDAKAGQG
jgi:hypothetical protein